MSKPSITNCPNTFFIIVHSFNCIFSSLSCFACVQIRHTPLSGGYCGEVPPLPIPNREVKLTCADGTAMQCGRVGSRLLLSRASDFERFLRLFVFMQFCFLIAALSHRLRGSFYLFTYSLLDFVNVYRFKIKKRVCHKSMAHPLLCYLLHNPRSIVAYSKKGII